MSKQDTSLDDIAQSITDLGTMIDGRFKSVESSLKKEITDQGVLLEDLTAKFDKNIDLLTAEMKVKKQVDNHEERIGELESGQKSIKSVVTLHSEQLAVK